MLLGNTSKKMLDKVTSMYRMPLMQCLRRTKQVISCRLPGIATTFKRLPSAWSLLQSVFGFHLLLFSALPIKYSNHHFLNHWPPIQTYRHNMPRSIPDHSIRISIDRVSSSNRAFLSTQVAEHSRYRFGGPNRAGPSPTSMHLFQLPTTAKPVKNSYSSSYLKIHQIIKTPPQKVFAASWER